VSVYTVKELTLNKQEINDLVQKAIANDKTSFDDVYTTSRSSRSDITPFVPEFEKLGAIVIVDFITGDFTGDISSVPGDRQFHVQGAEKVYKLGATVLTSLSVNCRVPTVFVDDKKKVELLSNPLYKKHISLLKAAKSNVASKLKKAMLEKADSETERVKIQALKPSQVIAQHRKTL